MCGVSLGDDGDTVVSGSIDQTVRLWRARTGEALQVLRGHADWVRSVALARDGQTIVSASDDSTVCVWQASTGDLLQTLEVPLRCVHVGAVGAWGSEGATPPPSRDALEVGEPPPPPCSAPSLCPARVPLTASASFNGICNRQ